MWKTGTGEFSFCEKPESENSFFFFFLSENSRFAETENFRFVENRNWRILVLWEIRIGEFFFFFNPEFSFYGKRELENSRFVENLNRRIFVFFFLSENSHFVETENSRFVENGNWRILVL